MLDAPHAAACKPAACMLGFDVVGTVVGGAITGAVAILVFLLTKRHTESGMRRDSARILLTEIDAIASQARPGILGISASESYHVGAYEGLHKSGNIRHIPHGLHPKLARLYGQYASGGPAAFDLDAAVDICASLDVVVRSNSGHVEKIRRWISERRGADSRRRRR